MEVKPGYKRSEVGLIPKDWRPTRLDEVTTKVGSGITPRGGSQNYRSHGRPFVRSQNVGWAELLLDELVFIDDDVHATFSATELQEGDVLLNITGASIGRCAIADSRLTGGNVNQHVCIVRTNENTSPRLISYLLLSDLGQGQIDSFQAGGNRQGLNFGQIRSITFPLPPTQDEQEGIAEALSDADALIESLEQLLAKKRQIKQGAMQELLTGKKRLPGFEVTRGCKQAETGLIPVDWEAVNLSSISTMKSGEGITSEYIDAFSMYPCYGGNGLRGFTTRYTHEGSYVLIGRVGALCGNVVGVTGRFFASEHAVVVTCAPGVDTRWLSFVLGQMRLNRYSEASAQPVLSVSKLLRLSVALPPTQAEQEAIASILSDIDTEIDAVVAKLIKARQIKQGMMQELLTGRIRLV